MTNKAKMPVIKCLDLVVSAKIIKDAVCIYSGVVLYGHKKILQIWGLWEVKKTWTVLRSHRRKRKIMRSQKTAQKRSHRLLRVNLFLAKYNFEVFHQLNFVLLFVFLNCRTIQIFLFFFLSSPIWFFLSKFEFLSFVTPWVI